MDVLVDPCLGVGKKGVCVLETKKSLILNRFVSHFFELFSCRLDQIPFTSFVLLGVE